MDFDWGWGVCTTEVRKIILDVVVLLHICIVEVLCRYILIVIGSYTSQQEEPIGGSGAFNT